MAESLSAQQIRPASPDRGPTPRSAARRPQPVPTADLLRDRRTVLMVGGMGMRLRPLTETCPKPLLPIGGRPLLEHTVDALRRQGLTRLTLCVHYRAWQFHDHFADGSRFGVEIDYVRESEPLGTAGPLGLLAQPPRRDFLVMNGDLIAEVDFAALLRFHRRRGVLATMCVHEYEVKVPYGIVETDGDRVTGIREQPAQRFLVNAGIYVLSPRVLDWVEPRVPLDMPVLFERMIADGRPTAVFPLHDDWLDIGRADDLARAQRAFEDVSRRVAGD